MNKFISTLLLLFWLSQVEGQENEASLLSFVNPMIGTGGHGHTFPGAVVPFGMVQLSPDTRLSGWDGCSGYHYSDSTIYGFSHTHLSGTGVGDLCDILVTPGRGSVQLNAELYKIPFQHHDEKAEPGYYSVRLPSIQTEVELTASSRVGFHQYHFKGIDDKFLLLDLKHRDQVLDASIEQVDAFTLIGYRQSRSWAKNQKCFFAMRFEQPISKLVIYKNGSEVPNAKKCKGAILQIALHFSPTENLIQFGCALSGVSAEGAIKNLNAEYQNDFQKIRKQAAQAWYEKLSKISVKDTDENKLTIFYTALYHCFIHPSLFSDVDGRYRGMDDKIHTSEHPHYTIFSLWDTYRALHPLLNIIDRKTSSDFMFSMIDMARQQKRLPVWELWSNETDCMIGYHAVSVLLDAYMKGIQMPDLEKVLHWMEKTSNYSHFGLEAYRKKGFIETNDASESVSRTLEYGYNDWCIAQFAGKLNKLQVYHKYIQKAQAYKHLLRKDPEVNMIQPRTEGGWYMDFQPSEVNHHYTEANGWQYAFYVPQDVEGLKKGLGGDSILLSQLDTLFYGSSTLSGRDQADITGLIGQYAHGNEPSHHLSWLYHDVGHPEKSIALHHHICHTFYKNDPDGLIGNEDCGQMSAWYVWTSLGMYPVCPGNNQYHIGIPIFQNATIHLENGSKIEIKNDFHGNDYHCIYTLNGKNRSRNYVMYDDFKNGMQWSILNCTSHQTHSENENTCNKNNIAPTSEINEALISTVPVWKPDCIQALNTSEDCFTYPYYGDQFGETLNPIFVKLEKTDASLANAKIKTYSVQGKVDTYSISQSNTFPIWQIKKEWKARYLIPWSNLYSGGGEDALVNGKFGTKNWQLGNWQGFFGTDMDIVFISQKKRYIGEFHYSFLSDTTSWIYLPSELTIYGSQDSITWNKLNSQNIQSAISRYQSTDVGKFKFTVKGIRDNYRYFRIIARNYGKLPPSHPSAGNPSWIFCDEIEFR